MRTWRRLAFSLSIRALRSRRPQAPDRRAVARGTAGTSRSGARGRVPVPRTRRERARGRGAESTRDGASPPRNDRRGSSPPDAPARSRSAAASASASACGQPPSTACRRRTRTRSEQGAGARPDRLSPASPPGPRSVSNRALRRDRAELRSRPVARCRRARRRVTIPVGANVAVHPEGDSVVTQCEPASADAGALGAATFGKEGRAAPKQERRPGLPFLSAADAPRLEWSGAPRLLAGAHRSTNTAAGREGQRCINQGTPARCRPRCPRIHTWMRLSTLARRGVRRRCRRWLPPWLALALTAVGPSQQRHTGAGVAFSTLCDQRRVPDAGVGGDRAQPLAAQRRRTCRARRLPGAFSCG